MICHNLPRLRKSKPQGEDELERVVEGKPVDGIDHTLKNPSQTY